MYVLLNQIFKSKYFHKHKRNSFKGRTSFPIKNDGINIDKTVKAEDQDVDDDDEDDEDNAVELEDMEDDSDDEG
ncbi:hypothetical protein Glove_402g8 [Diversispora epigaea]|uniref:Uncharacterized protein n=1 Tax=Diversispora epigaea TaxID=1348612 RepID=A0A397GZL8_9GLOM|nr:hypothetical protein Glove_402g8 [Diversispora epigaea]